MKLLIILFLIFLMNPFAQVITIKGKILDSETEHPLEDANITIKGNDRIGTVSNSQGIFILTADFSPDDILEVSYIGYAKYSHAVSSFSSSPSINIIKLIPSAISSQSILIEAFRDRMDIAPINYSSISRSEINENYTLQDIPEFLSSLPSTTFYSESGNGIGYNYLSIRGFDQRRISVSINGIPQNDPEDHNVYWLDFPDLISSSELIQVQRGSSSGIIGYPAIGGSINIITSSFANETKLNLLGSIGSFNTRKYGVAVSSGLVNQKYSFYAKLSQTLSSGYRDKSWVKFNSYHLSAVRYDDNLTTQINFYGGPISDGLAYTGLPKFTIKDKNLRRKNYSYWEADDNQKRYSYKFERRSDEIENFSQPHFELLNDYKFNDDLTFNSSLFLVLGEGFFDYDGSWADTSYLRLISANGFYPQNNPGNVLIRAQVENKQFGWIPRLNLKHKNGNLIFGTEFRIHKSIHWGSISYGENLPSGITKDYRYYFYNGGKDILNNFINETYELNEKIKLLGELQLAFHKYRLSNEKYISTDFTVQNLFINSKFAINYKFPEGQILRFSFARVSREPRLKNYYDAAESSGGEIPQFEKKRDGSYDFSRPYVKPETMNDFELGGYIQNNNYSFSVNLFYMLFDNEIVKNGKLDRFGQPITGNMENTIHQGIELSASVNLIDGLEVYSNATLSKNIIKRGKYFVNSQTSLDLSGNKINGFPDFLANFVISYKKQGLYLKLNGKYVSKFYSDNYDEKLREYLNLSSGFVDYIDNVNDAYFSIDFYCSYDFHFIESLAASKIFLQVNNVFDQLYSAYAIGKEFFPAAERNYLVGIQIGL
ncbi:MAG TPA: TonB-dependent receptor [Ignavibacteriaceae bacterium]